MATKRAAKSKIVNPCEQQNGGLHEYEIVNLTVMGGHTIHSRVVPKYVAFCRRCAKTTPVVSQ